MKAIAKDPAERFQTASEFLDALAQISLDESLDEAATVQTVAIRPTPLPSLSNTAKPPSISPLGKPSSSAPPPPRNTPPPSRIAPEPSRTTPKPSRSVLDPSVFDSVSKELAAFIGPIAKLVVKRAAERCSSVDDLYGAVAMEITSEKDRSSFLAHRKRHS